MQKNDAVRRHVLLLLLLLLFAGCSNNDLDPFAQCLADKGVMMYGAYWCPHCADQKKLFGASFDYMTYIECSLPERAGQTQICIDANITSYPTWEFAGGSRREGILSLEALSARTGCPLPG